MTATPHSTTRREVVVFGGLSPSRVAQVHASRLARYRLVSGSRSHDAGVPVRVVWEVHANPERGGDGQ